jgi:hypothetical protein
MASGHVYRAERPNTWLHRPMLQSEDSPCQPGAVHTWPIATYCTATQPRSLTGYSGNRRAAIYLRPTLISRMILPHIGRDVAV